VSVEQITELMIIVEDVEALTSAQQFELSGMGARCHPDARRPALEAVSAELSFRKNGCVSAHLHKPTDRTGV